MDEIRKRNKGVRFNMSLANDICLMIEKKMTISKICKLPRMPDRRSIHRWRHQHPKFNEMLKVSEEIRLTNLVDELIDITDEDVLDLLWSKLMREPTKVEASIKMQSIKLRLESIKFLSAKLYSDKTTALNSTSIDKVVNVINYSSEKKVGFTMDIPNLQPEYLKNASSLTPAQQAQIDYVTKR